MWGFNLKEHIIDIIVTALERLSLRPKLIAIALIFSGFLGAGLLSISPFFMAPRPDAVRAHEALVAEKQAAIMNELVDKKIDSLKIDELRDKVSVIGNQQARMLESFIKDTFDQVQRGDSITSLRRNAVISGCQHIDNLAKDIDKMCSELMDVMLTLPRNGR